MDFPGLPPLIRALHDAARYPHSCEPIRLIETHISWVLLTGAYAYKVKKPLDLGFLDFSTLERRRVCCEEEIRLNRRLAPQIYLEVVPIGGSPEAPVLGAAQPAIEYAVKMVQFPQDSQLDRVLARGELQPAHIDTLAQRIAQFHEAVPRVPAERPWGEPAAVFHPMEENFRQMRPLLGDPGDLAQLGRLEEWTRARYEALTPTLAARKREGYIRECHGDMHLANMALWRGELIVFDCIEFNDNLRWIDVMSEMAFLTMDLEDRGEPALAARCLNAYLEHSGDYEGLAVLRFYQVYRALVRAKVAAIRLGQGSLGAAELDAVENAYRGYLRLAESYTRPAPRLLAITHGPSGSGKTTVTQPLLEALGAMRVRSDVERKRLFGLKPQERSDSSVGGGIYTAEAGERTYQRLESLAAAVLHAGLPVIAEATYLQRRGRDAMGRLAAALGVPFVILDCRASEAVLRRRITRRESRGDDASEAGIPVLEHQLAGGEPPAQEERSAVITVDTEQAVDTAGLIARLRTIAARGGPGAGGPPGDGEAG